MKEKFNGTGNGCRKSLLFATATDDELSVAEILLDLPQIMCESKIHSAKFEWKGKRRRSSLAAAAPVAAPVAVAVAVAVVAPAVSSQSQSPAEIGVEETRQLPVKPESSSAAAAPTTSPDTPLSFSPSSESDESNKHSPKKNFKKRSREEYLDIVDQLTQRRDCLRGEVENVRKYYNKLKAENSELKAMRQEALKNYQTKEQSQMETGVTSYPLQQAHGYHHVQQAFQFPIAAQFYTNGPRMVNNNNNVGPLGIPDLNLSAEEAVVEQQQPQPLDGFEERRARYAEARRLRKGMIKIKSMRNACGIKLPRIS